MGRGRRDRVGMDGGIFEGVEKSKGEKKLTGGGWLGSVRGLACEGTLRDSPGERADCASRGEAGWVEWKGTAERRPEAHERRQPGRARRTAGARNAKLRGNWRRDLCPLPRGRTRSPRPPRKEERSQSEAGRGDWWTKPEGRDAEVKRAAEDPHWLEKLTKLERPGRSWVPRFDRKIPGRDRAGPGHSP